MNHREAVKETEIAITLATNLRSEAIGKARKQWLKGNMLRSRYYMWRAEGYDRRIATLQRSILPWLLEDGAKSAAGSGGDPSFGG